MAWLLVLLLSITLAIHLVYAYFMKYCKSLLVKHSFTFNIAVGLTFIGLAVYMTLHSWG